MEYDFNIKGSLPDPETDEITQWDSHHEDESDSDMNGIGRKLPSSSTEALQEIIDSEEHEKDESGEDALGAGDESASKERYDTAESWSGEDESEEEGPDVPEHPERRTRSSGPVGDWSKKSGRVWAGSAKRADEEMII